MGGVIGLVGVVAVVGGKDRGADLLCDLEELWVGAELFGDAVVLELDEQVVSAKDVLQPARTVDRLVKVCLLYTSPSPRDS